VLNKKD